MAHTNTSLALRIETKVEEDARGIGTVNEGGLTSLLLVLVARLLRVNGSWSISSSIPEVISHSSSKLNPSHSMSVCRPSGSSFLSVGEIRMAVLLQLRQEEGGR